MPPFPRLKKPYHLQMMLLYPEKLLGSFKKDVSFSRSVLTCLSLALLSTSLSGQSMNVKTDGGALETGGISVGSPSQLKYVTITLKNVSLLEALNTVTKEAGASIVFDAKDGLLKEELASTRSEKFKETRLEIAVGRLLEGTGYEGVLSADGSVVMIRKVGVQDKSQGRAVGTGVVQGLVVDSSTRAPVPGVVVKVEGENIIFRTDDKGNFRLSGLTSGKHVLSFKVIGYKNLFYPLEVISDSIFNVKVELVPTVSTLSEVVTTATGKQRRVEIANDIVRIDVSQIRERAPVRNVIDILEAAYVPGVLITRASGEPGSTSRIRIRGIGSIAASNDPIIVVDGVWVDAGGVPSYLDALDPSIIESVEIVRGPSASTLYGQDASNGVIVITTKKGKVGQTRWSFSFEQDWGVAPGRRPIIYKGLGYQRTSTTRMECPNIAIIRWECIQDSLETNDPNHPLLKGEGTARINTNTISVDGGVNSFRYSITGTSQQEIGARRIKVVDHIRLRLLNQDMPSDFHFPSSFNRVGLTSTFGISPYKNTDILVTIAGTQNKIKNNTLYTEGIQELSLDTIELLSRRITIEESRQPSKSMNILSSLQVTWHPRSYIRAMGQGGVQQASDESGASQFGVECRVGECRGIPGTRSERSGTRSVYTGRLQVNGSPWSALGGKLLEVRPSIGIDLRKNNSSFISFGRDDIPPGERNMSGGYLINPLYNRVSSATGGWYVSATIGLFERIYFDLGLRQDVGSSIAANSNTRYPKLGSSWLISDEGFWKNNNLVNSLRLRSAFGHSAVQPDLADVRGRFQSGYVYTESGFERTIDFYGLGNPRLQPERATEVEFGFDSEMLFNRVNMIFTFAHKINTNAFIIRPMPASVGVFGGSRLENIARVSNQSLELSLNTRLLDTRRFMMDIDYTLSLLGNRVDKLGDGVTPFGVGQNDYRIVEGYPVAGIWSQPILGYGDINNDGIIGPDEIVKGDSLSYIGWTQPRYRSGYGIRMTGFSNLSIDARLAYQSQYIQSMRLYNMEGAENSKSPLEEQAIAHVNSLRQRRPVSDLRLNSASISYRLPRSITEKLKSRSLVVALRGSNLGLWTNYRGRDPGVNSAGFSEGLHDSGNVIPQSRRFVLSINWGV